MKPEQYLKRFKEITEDMYTITEAKNSDYTAGADDAFANFRVVENMNICSVEQGFLTRMTDKMARLAGLSTNKECKVKDEKYTDTLLDLANYALLLKIYLESKGDVKVDGTTLWKGVANDVYKQEVIPYGAMYGDKE